MILLYELLLSYDNLGKPPDCDEGGDIMRIEMLRKLNLYLARVSIFLIMAALIAGPAGCTPSQNLEIRTWYDLDAVRDNLAGNYTLTSHLDSSSAGYAELAGPTANGGKGWQPIGTGFEDQFFTGSFDGQGYEIRDLFINRPDENYIGLFGGADEGGHIENTGVVDAYVIGGNGTSGLVGVNGGTLANSYSAGNVTGQSWVGGLVGANGGTVNYCYSTGSVTGFGYVGGLMGGSSYGAVSNSYFAGNVTGVFIVGGLVGWNERGSVSKSYSAGSATGVTFVGGLVGANGGNVSDSYSLDSVSGNSSVGGLIGDNKWTVSNCYAAGSVVGNNDTGGLVGEGTYGDVTNSFWDTKTSGQSTSAGGTGKTTAEMHDITTFSDAGWNIIAVGSSGERNPSYIWNIVDDVTYPLLSWQPV